ncbi:MAG: acetyl-CoA carboxylase biotin carboxyl carrier protein [Polyangiaceae bacterium]|jgi:acetyl-CoA carboxylase biotin carboxyl carrier protein
MTVDIEKLRALLDVLTEKDIAEFEHEDEATRIRVVRGARTAAVVTQLAPQAPQLVSSRTEAPAAAPTTAEPASDHVDVTSPFVGTFYRSPSPDAPSFVEVGSVVRIGQTLCIVEAMKLMNEIEAEHSGTITDVFAQSGKAVEFGQKLFRIKKT